MNGQCTDFILLDVALYSLLHSTGLIIFRLTDVHKILRLARLQILIEAQTRSSNNCNISTGSDWLFAVSRNLWIERRQFAVD